MRLSVTRSLPASPDTIWAYLTIPELMNQWSRAAVALDDHGDRGHPGAPGALRTVTLELLGRKLALHEVVRDSIPGAYLHYEVLPSFPLTHHRGTIHIDDLGASCQIRWQVELECAHVAVAQLARRSVIPQLEDSLDVLQSLRYQTIAPVAPWTPIPAPTAADWRGAEAILDEQARHADELTENGDPKRWFAIIYHRVTKGLVEAARAGRFIYPAWVLKMIPGFHGYYWRNLERWNLGHEQAVESHWARAFATMERGSREYPGEAGQLFHGLILGIKAHVDSDLPRSLAEIYADHYAALCDFVRFRGDYLTTGAVFQAASQEITDLIPRSYLPSWARVIDATLPRQLTDRLRYRRFYDLPKHRRMAFRMGAELSEMLARRR